jgi:hypothetical protein
VLAYIVGRRAEVRERRDEGWGVVEVRRRVDRDIALVGIVLAMSMWGSREYSASEYVCSESVLTSKSGRYL